MTYNELVTYVENNITEDEIIKRFQELMNNCRCPKCVYEGLCRRNFDRGDCQKYKRDPPDGGYYG